MTETVQFGFWRSLIYGALITVGFFALLETAAHFWEFRDVEQEMAAKVSGPQREGSFRLFVFGGSTVEGVHVSEWGFVSQLEFWLRRLQPDKPLEVYNFGRAGRPSAYVRRKVESALPHEPDLIVVLSGHNEFLSQHVELLPNRILAEFALSRSLMRKLERAQAPGRDDVSHARYVPYDRKAPLFKEKLAAYEANLRHVVELTIDRGVPLILVTAPANIADWPPVTRASHGTAGEDRVEQSAVALREKLAVAAEDARLAYALGNALRADGNPRAAYDAYQQARNNDPLPWRVLSGMNDSVRKFGQFAGVQVVDAERLFEQYAEHQLVGDALVSDNCHPSPLGNAIIARGILAAMAETGLHVTQDHTVPAPQAAVAAFMSEFDARRQEALWMKFYLDNARYAMKPPFYNYAAARRYLDLALAADANNWQAWANLATVNLFEGKTRAGQQALARATDLRGGTLDPAGGATPFLSEALALSGLEANKR